MFCGIWYFSCFCYSLTPAFSRNITRRRYSNGKNNFQDNNSKKNDSGIDSKSSKVSSTNSNNSNTDIKRDVANEFTIQRDNSGIQSSCSDEYNQTSEKYNFDLITSSIDETTTSLSKKTVRKQYIRYFSMNVVIKA